MDYCDVVWSGCTKTIAKKLEVVQNNAARAILGASYRPSATALRTQLGWVTLETRRELNTAVKVQCMTRVSAFRSALKLFYNESSN